MDNKKTQMSNKYILFLPAARASLQASSISIFIVGFSYAIVSPTTTNLSTAKLTACPTLSRALACLSELTETPEGGRLNSRKFTKFDILNVFMCLCVCVISYFD